ncbi:flagella basal body P-ring formation protein FlgA [Geomonas sp. Red276]
MKALVLAAILFLIPAASLALPAPVSVPQPVATVTVPEREVKKVVAEFLVQRAAPLEAKISVKRIGYSGDLKLPAGVVSYEVIAPERWEGYGNGSLALIVRVDGEVKKNLTVLVEVEALTDMVVATRTLERGEVLAASDLSVASRDMAHVQGRFLKSIDEAVGLRVKSSMRANSPVRGDYLERVPVVKSGQLVTIVAENEVVRITALGRAKNAGAVGDQIMVVNTSSNKDVPARVVDANTVKVDF